MPISLLAYLRLFQDSFVFGETTSSHFFRVTTSTQQLLFRSSYFFRAYLLLLRSSFSEQSLLRSSYFFQSSCFFRAKLLPNSHHLRIGSYLGQLPFGTATFLEEILFGIMISTEELLFQSRHLCKASTFSEKLYFGEKLIFQKINIFRSRFFLITFSDSSA